MLVQVERQSLELSWKGEMSSVGFAQSWIICVAKAQPLFFQTMDDLSLLRTPSNKSCGLSWTPKRQRVFYLLKVTVWRSWLKCLLGSPSPLHCLLCAAGVWFSSWLSVFGCDCMPCCCSDSRGKGLLLPWLSRKCLKSKLCLRPKAIERYETLWVMGTEI